MRDKQKRLLLLGGAGLGLFWLLNRQGAAGPSGSPATSGSCPVAGQIYTPGMAIPRGCAVGHDSTGRTVFVDLQLFGNTLDNLNIAPS